MTGIEPAYSAWEVDSTHLGGFVSVRRDLTAMLGSWLSPAGFVHTAPYASTAVRGGWTVSFGRVVSPSCHSRRRDGRPESNRKHSEGVDCFNPSIAHQCLRSSNAISSIAKDIMHHVCTTLLRGSAAKAVRDGPRATGARQLPRSGRLGRPAMVDRQRPLGRDHRHAARDVRPAADTPRPDADAHHYRDSITDTVLSSSLVT